MDVTLNIEAEEVGQPTMRDRSQCSVFGLDSVTADMEQVSVAEPGGFANWAGVSVSDDDSVTVSISAGDPRGAFTMTVHRSAEDGALYLTVPNPGDGFPHMKLTEIRPGFYRVSRP